MAIAGTHDADNLRESGDPLGEYHWPESEFYVSEKHRLVYCPIQKVACTSLKLWWAELVDGTSAPFVSLDERDQTSFDHAHFALNQRYKHHHASRSLGRRPFVDDDWFRLVFVRNPWARLVSAFVNKFVSLHELAQPFFDEAHARWRRKRPRAADALRSILGRPREEELRGSIWLRIRGKRAWHNEFTFRHFVELLADANLDEDETDLHWRPQYRFLGNVSFHLVGRFERLQDDLQSVADRLGLRIPLPAANRTVYGDDARGSMSYANCPLKVLRKLPAMPSFQKFYTPRLRDRVGDLYRRDVERFGYDFDGPLDTLPARAKRAA
jgi:hypothetical protein